MKPETKEKIFRILNITTWCILVLGLFFLVGFVEKKQDNLICKNFIININEDEEIFFVQKENIRQLLRNRRDSIINQPVHTINIPQIEKVINSHPSVSNADVYLSINGDLNIDIIQREPLIRIINRDNESYYIDTAGKLMPLSESYSAKILIANGNINEPYAKRYMYGVEEILQSNDAKDKTILDDLFVLARYINKNKFWKAQIQQIYVNQDSEFEIIPRVGDHIILFGEASDIEEKFSKLMIFYKEAMNKTGWWNNYSVVNLKYKNQIVCTKKEETPKGDSYQLQAALSNKIKESNQHIEEAPQEKLSLPDEKQISKPKKSKKNRSKKLK